MGRFYAGMFSADPRFVPAARLIRQLSYREAQVSATRHPPSGFVLLIPAVPHAVVLTVAQELAAMGAKVLHPRCLLPAMLSRIPVEIRNTMDPGDDAAITVVCDAFMAPSRSASDLVAPSRAPSPDSSPLASPGSGGTGGSSRVIFASGPSGSLTLDPSREGSGGAAGLKSPREDRTQSPLPAASEAFSALLSSATASVLTHGQHPPVAASGGVAKVLAVARRKGATLVTLSAFSMWGHSGFLTRVFEPFATHGVSVDLIATSQYAVSLTLDHIPDGVHGEVFKRVLSGMCAGCAELRNLVDFTLHLRNLLKCVQRCQRFVQRQSATRVPLSLSSGEASETPFRNLALRCALFVASLSTWSLRQLRTSTSPLSSMKSSLMASSRCAERKSQWLRRGGGCT
jgi:hypothetical protein